MIDAAKRAKPHMDIDVLCFGLLATAWGWTSSSAEPSREFLQAVIEAVRELPRYLGEMTHVDPVDYALHGSLGSRRGHRKPRGRSALRAIDSWKVTDQLESARVYGSSAKVASRNRPAVPQTVLGSPSRAPFLACVRHGTLVGDTGGPDIRYMIGRPIVYHLSG